MIFQDSLQIEPQTLFILDIIHKTECYFSTLIIHVYNLISKHETFLQFLGLYNQRAIPTGNCLLRIMLCSKYANLLYILYSFCIAERHPLYRQTVQRAFCYITNIEKFILHDPQ